MDYFRAAAISASGMLAQKTRIEAAALNLANMNTTHAAGEPGFRPVTAVIHAQQAFAQALAGVCARTLLIAFSFGAFIEGAAGFGTPVAIVRDRRRCGMAVRGVVKARRAPASVSRLASFVTSSQSNSFSNLSSGIFLSGI
jgi:flagellar basal body rod protein FlgC